MNLDERSRQDLQDETHPANPVNPVKKNGMKHARFYHLLAVLILAVTAASLLSHYAADAVCLATGPDEAALCSDAPATQSIPAASETLHAGYAIPTITAVVLLTVFIFNFATWQYTAVTFSPTPLPPPPKR